jgi:hypothetical protein
VGISLDLKGEEYIRKLAQQDVRRPQRPQIADALAKGNLSLTIGVGYGLRCIFGCKFTG